MIGSAVALVAALAQGGSCLPSDPKSDARRPDWYCDLLAAAGQTRLAGAPAFRFAYVPAFHAPRVITVVGGPERPVVEGILLNGAGCCGPGQVVVKRSRRLLTDAEWRLLQQRLDNAGIWEPTEYDPAGVDGAVWLLEGRHGLQHRVHSKFSPESRQWPQYYRACTYLLELAGLLPRSDELY